MPDDARAPRRTLSPATLAGATVMLGIAAKGVQDRLTDPDLWWHLKTGQLIVARHAIPATDPFSFTRPGARWIVQEWGSEVLMHAVESLGGLHALVVWRAFMLVLLYGIVARMIIARAGLTAWTWGLVGLVAFAGVQSWTERPTLFSYLLFVATLALLDRGNRRVLWFIPLAAVWVNLHGMVLVGIGTVALVALTEWLKVWLEWDGADRAWARLLALAAGGGLLATLANPYGPLALSHGFALVRVASPIVREWASPNFHDPVALLFLCVVLLAVAALALVPARPDPTDVALTLAFTTLGLLAVRNVPMSSIALGLVIARALPGALRGALGEPRPRAEPGRGEVILRALATAVVVAILGAVIARNVTQDPLPRSYPVATIRALPGPSVRLFARDDWAGFAIDRRWPAVRVAFDTRVDLYGAELARLYRRTAAGLDGWDRTLRTWCVTDVLLADGDGLTSRLRDDPSWTLIRTEALATGASAALYVRRLAPAGCAPRVIDW